MLSAVRRLAALPARGFAPAMYRQVVVAPAVRAFCAAPQTFLDTKEVTQRVLEVVKGFDKVDPAKATEAAHFINDLGLDSLDVVELCMAIEEEFCITIPDAEAEKIHTTEDAIKFVAAHPQAK